MNTKQIILVVVLFAIAVVLFIILARRTGMIGGPTPPAAMLGQPVTLIDEKTCQTKTLPLGEWDKLGRDPTGRIKNPETGEYTMCPMIVCASCGQQIPAPMPPPYQPPPKGQAMKGLPPEMAPRADEYMCPRCSKHAYLLPPGKAARPALPARGMRGSPSETTAQ